MAMPEISDTNISPALKVFNAFNIEVLDHSSGGEEYHYVKGSAYKKAECS
jgi:hypothetical protein